MYKSKEYNGMDILDSIFSDQRQKDVTQYKQLQNSILSITSDHANV
jgi:hypothetical protein